MFAEGCHGSLTKKLVQKFDLRKDSCPQTYALGVKEVWELDPAKHQPGLVVHSLGFPLDYQTVFDCIILLGNFIIHIHLVWRWVHVSF